MRPLALPLRLAACALMLAALAAPAGAQTPAPAPPVVAPPDLTTPDLAVPAPPVPVPVPAPAPGQITATVHAVSCGGSQADGTDAIDTTPGYFAPPRGGGPPVPWNDFEVAGDALDAAATVRDLVEPAFKKLQTTSEPERTVGIAAAVAAYGYQLLGVSTVQSPSGVVASLRLARLPVVRKVDITIRDRGIRQSLSTALLDEEVRRRLQVKVGSYVPQSHEARHCKLIEEQRHVEDYLHDEGYYSARVTVTEARSSSVETGTKLEVIVYLGAAYTPQKRPPILHPSGELNVSQDEIWKVFDHCATQFGTNEHRLCFGTARFTRTQHQADLVAVTNLFHKKGYPAARVTSDYSPTGSFDRQSNEVRFKIIVDQRRFLDVSFENIDFDGVGITNDQLREQLTFDAAGSADDVEAANSARALALYLQKRGHFEARVTWTRERVAESSLNAGFDRLHYWIDLGPTRAVLDVEFQGVKALDAADLRELVYTKANRLAGTLFGTNASATSDQLAADVERIALAYHDAGYRDARVAVTAATKPEALDNAALTAALVSADRGDGLYVKFTVDEGTATLLDRAEIMVDGDALLCDGLITRLGELYGETKPIRRVPMPALPTGGGACALETPNLKFKEADVQRTGEALRDWLWNHGRTRATVDYRWEVDGPHRVVARYQVRRTDALTMGKVVVRGNFATRSSVITGANGELKLFEGQPLTADSLAQAAQKLRATGLFDSVSVQLPNLCSTPDPACIPASNEVNAVVVVQERYDYLAQVELSTGYSSYSSFFGTVALSQRNIAGLGIYGEASVTEGTKIFSVDGTLRIPRWLMRRAQRALGIGTPSDNLQTELTGFIRNQDTPNFGEVQTKGLSLALTYAPPARARSTPTAHAQSFVVGLHYDFRLRDRNIDALRPIGVDSDQSQVPVSTRTGSVGLTVELDRRVDRHGSLSPLSPEAGYRVGATASIASVYLLGQDEFIKLTATGTKYWPVGANLVIRADLRYDQGLPLFGAVLLPEVERYFAGGDSTVRGYDDDKLSTEIVQVTVPPLGTVQQLRILPSGGNIRAMSSLDAQLHVYSVFATALFTDAGMITNQWSTVTPHDVRPSVGMALLRAVTPFGTLAVEYAVPLLPHLGDDPRGRFHISFAARAQF